MFAGIVELKLTVSEIEKLKDIVRISLPRPSSFDDLSIGDSIAINGVCLTLEKFDSEKMQFALAAETLNIIDIGDLKKRALNIERSLQLGSRIHGHFVSGHVDTQGTVEDVGRLNESTQLKIKVPGDLAAYIWKKGSIAINGVSLTVNEFRDNLIELCIIPETLNRTNLSELVSGDRVNIEVDQMARGIVHATLSSQRQKTGDENV